MDKGPKAMKKHVKSLSLLPPLIPKNPPSPLKTKKNSLRDSRRLSCSQEDISEMIKESMKISSMKFNETQKIQEFSSLTTSRKHSPKNGTQRYKQSSDRVKMKIGSFGFPGFNPIKARNRLHTQGNK